MNNVFVRIKSFSYGMLMLFAFTLMFLALNLLSVFPAKAEVAVAPSSYVYDGNNVEMINDKPEYINGKKVEYRTAHNIPINPVIETSNGERFEIKAKHPCPGQGNLGHCTKRFSANKY